MTSLKRVPAVRMKPAGLTNPLPTNFSSKSSSQESGEQSAARLRDYIRQLDAALLRPGRFDCIITVGGFVPL